MRSRPVLVRADGKVMRMMLAGPLWTLVILLGVMAAEASVKANGLYLFHFTDTGAGEAEKPGAHSFPTD